MADVKGRYLGHSDKFGFLYEYDCSLCGRTFRQMTPDLNAPAICHRCFTGENVYRRSIMESRPREEKSG